MAGLLFAAVIAVPAVGYGWFGWNPIVSFWFAYVATRPLGASFADWMGKPHSLGGLGLGAGIVALALTAVIFCLVAYLAITRRDVQSARRRRGGAHRHVPAQASRPATGRRRPWGEPSPESLD